MSYVFMQTSTPMEVDCGACKGSGMEPCGHSDRDWCSRCGGSGCDFLDLACLGHNLAVAGALTEARNRGYTDGESAGFDMGYMDACNGRAGC